jgi:hypothetical protein
MFCSEITNGRVMATHAHHRANARALGWYTLDSTMPLWSRPDASWDGFHFLLCVSSSEAPHALRVRACVRACRCTFQRALAINSEICLAGIDYRCRRLDVHCRRRPPQHQAHDWRRLQDHHHAAAELRVRLRRRRLTAASWLTPSLRRPARSARFAAAPLMARWLGSRIHLLISVDHSAG